MTVPNMGNNYSKCSNSEGYLDVEHVCLPFKFLLEKTPANERNIMDSACAYTTGLHECAPKCNHNNLAYLWLYEVKI